MLTIESLHDHKEQGTALAPHSIDIGLPATLSLKTSKTNVISMITNNYRRTPLTSWRAFIFKTRFETGTPCWKVTNVALKQATFHSLSFNSALTLCHTFGSGTSTCILLSLQLKRGINQSITRSLNWQININRLLFRMADEIIDTKQTNWTRLSSVKKIICKGLYKREIFRHIGISPLGNLWPTILCFPK